MATAKETAFTASHGVQFHGTGIWFTGTPGAGYSFTAPDAATAQKVRDLAAAEPQWGITEVTS